MANVATLDDRQVDRTRVLSANLPKRCIITEQHHHRTFVCECVYDSCTIVCSCACNGMNKCAGHSTARTTLYIPKYTPRLSLRGRNSSSEFARDVRERPFGARAVLYGECKFYARCEYMGI